MYRQFLKTYVARSKQRELNKESPPDTRWCNFLCQDYIPSENFHKKNCGQNMCISCVNKLVLTKKYIKDGRLTKEEFKKDPNILNKFNKQPKLEGSIECVECKITKNIGKFPIGRNICKKCRLEQSKKRVEERLKMDIKQLEDNKDDEKVINDILRRTPVSSIHAILKHYGLTRKSTDKKDDSIVKIIQYFRSLQDPLKCMGNCGFTLQEEFSYCDKCQTTTKINVAEKNLMFKENLVDFMDDRREITEEEMYSLNSYCILAIAEYLGITLFKQKVKGNTKSKMVKTINEHLKEKYKDQKKVVKTPDLEINSVMILCREDGYVNATALCKAGGKRFYDWNRLESTKELIDELKSENGDSRFGKLVDIKKGGNDKNLQGSWIHPDLAVQLAQWISPKFALRVSKWVRELAMTGSVVLYEEKQSAELMELQKNYRLLKMNHGKLLEKRSHHKFKNGFVYYIISDMESKEKKYKPGFEGVDINIRLAQHRSTMPGIRLEMLVYANSAECRILEKTMLTRYSGKRKYNNHEWIYGIDKDHIMQSTQTMLDFLGVEYVLEEEIEKYNIEI